MLILAVAGYLMATNTYPPLIAALESGIFGGLGSAMGVMLGWAAVMIVLYSTIYVALTRLALGLPMTSGLVRVSLGAAEWRGVGSLLALALIALLFLIVYSLLIRAAVAMPGAGGGVFALLGAFAVYLAMILCVVRLGFLMFPANVAEGAGLARSWELTAGNFWRSFAIVLLTMLPLSCVFVLAEYVILGSAAFPRSTGGGAAPAVAVEQIRATLDHMLALIALGAVFAPVFSGLVASASAFAYRALVPPSAA